MQTTCQRCGSEFRTYPSRLARGEDRYCSRECSNPARGRAREANPNWRGGRFVRSDGYVSIRVDGRDVLEHRHVAPQIEVLEEHADADCVLLVGHNPGLETLVSLLTDGTSDQGRGMPPGSIAWMHVDGDASIEPGAASLRHFWWP